MGFDQYRYDLRLVKKKKIFISLGSGRMKLKMMVTNTKSACLLFSLILVFV